MSSSCGRSPSFPAGGTPARSVRRSCRTRKIVSPSPQTRPGRSSGGRSRFSLSLLLALLVGCSSPTEPVPSPRPPAPPPLIVPTLETERTIAGATAYADSLDRSLEIVQARLEAELGVRLRLAGDVRWINTPPPGERPAEVGEGQVWLRLIDGGSVFSSGQCGGGDAARLTATISTGCGNLRPLWRWNMGRAPTGGKTEIVILHELVHVFGAVPPSAPHACGPNHVCDDPDDLMHNAFLRAWSIDRDGEDYRALVLKSPYVIRQ